MTSKAGFEWLRLQGKVLLLGELWAELFDWNDLVRTRRGWCWGHGRQVKSPVHPGAGGEGWSVTALMVRFSRPQLDLNKDNGSTFYLDAAFPHRPGPMCVFILLIHSCPRGPVTGQALRLTQPKGSRPSEGAEEINGHL